jgi:cytochrome c oxidase subunit II
VAIAIAIALLVLISVAFQLFSPWWLTPIASNWGSIDDALMITMWICGLVFIALNLFMAWTIIRYRHRARNKAHYEPENASLERKLTFWTGVGIAGMLAPGLIAWNQFVTVPKEATVVEATGQQWQWGFRFPGRDGVLGTASTANVTPDNPFGLSQRDPYGKDDILVESGDVHLPVNKPVKFVLRSKDVLHDFYVPQFRAKMDLVPGIVTYFWMTPTRTGTFEILCAELCGVGHHMMRGNVIVDNDKAYQDWLGQQSTYAQLLARAETGKERLALAEPVAKPSIGGQ